MKKLNIQLLLTGNELMSGDVIDSNSSKVGEYLKDIGLTITRKVTIADDVKMLANEIELMSQQADILIINGGLGPTVDDLTAEVLAKVIGQPLQQHPLALQHLSTWCKLKQTELNVPTLKQALLPKNCNIIANKIGSAVGIHVTHNQCDIFCTPGVPSELFMMLSNEILPTIQHQHPNNSQIDITRMHTFGIGESSLQKIISNVFPEWPDEVELGFRADFPLLELKLTTQRQQDLAIKNHYAKEIELLIGEHYLEHIEKKTKTLAEHLLNLLQQKKLTITTAESCTGGLIASQLTRISGSSKSFEAGFVTYSNNMKTKILAVDEEIITNFGAVSKETVLAMATGALKKSQANLVIAVSGIAGPTGGSEEKPVGSVWIAWGTKHNLQTQYFCITASRHYFQEIVAARSLDLIRRLLINSKNIPHYIEPINR